MCQTAVRRHELIGITVRSASLTAVPPFSRLDGGQAKRPGILRRKWVVFQPGTGGREGHQGLDEALSSSQLDLAQRERGSASRCTGGIALDHQRHPSRDAVDREVFLNEMFGGLHL